MPPLVHCLKQGIWIAGAFSRAWKNRASMHRHFGASSCSSAAIGTTSCVLHSLREGQTAKGQPSPKARRAAGARLHSVGKRTFKEHVGRNLESEAWTVERRPSFRRSPCKRKAADVRLLPTELGIRNKFSGACQRAWLVSSTEPTKQHRMPGLKRFQRLSTRYGKRL